MSQSRIPMISGIYVGLSARKSIDIYLTDGMTRITFRLRRGNGHYYSKTSVIYQDVMTYYTPFNPQSPAQQARRSHFTDGVAAWQVLPESEKDAYRQRSTKTKHATGFTLFMSEWMFTYS